MTDLQNDIRGLYLITDDNRDGRLFARVESALEGGVRLLQYRAKALPFESRVEEIRRLLPLCRQKGVRLIVNDCPELARTCDADGVHLGQGDGGIAEARTLLGPEKIIGLSTRTVEQALRAKAEGADYIGVGAIFPTRSKGDAVHVGVERLKEIRRVVRLPIVAIGGITAENASKAIDAGADAIAVISAVMGDTTPRIAAREISLLFNRRYPAHRGRVLTIAGSDSGGGAGIQADLKTISLLGSYGMSAITALTAQNTQGVRSIQPVPANFVEEQIETVLEDIGADTAKTGMLFSADIIGKVASSLDKRGVPAVIDPVMLAKGGAALLKREAIDCFRQKLLPLAYLLTPNLPEAEALCEFSVKNEFQMEQAAYSLQTMGARNILIKGGHLRGDAIDLLLAGKTVYRLSAPRHTTRNTHGTGCTYSAAIATFLAQGYPLIDAVTSAKRFISEAIRTANDLGSGHGPVNHWHGARSFVPSNESS